ncbi:MAG: alpha/beta hydrolase [Sphingomicrobium sp.]
MSKQGWEDRYWTSRDGLRLHYRDYAGSGDRPPLICLHGLTRNARDFGDLAERFAGDWRLIVPDFRGRGLSDYDPLPVRYAPPTYAGDIMQMMDVLGVEQAVFVGTSLGGLVTMAIAAIAQQRIAAAVLNDVGPELEETGLQRIRSYVGKPALFHSWRAAARYIARGNAAMHPRYDESDWIKMAQRVCRSANGEILFDYDMAAADNVLAGAGAPPIDAWPYFRALAHAPLLIVRGELSDLLSEENARRMAAEHPDAELVTVQGVGHAPDLDEPEAVAGIERLLAKADAR